MSRLRADRVLTRHPTRWDAVGNVPALTEPNTLIAAIDLCKHAVRSSHVLFCVYDFDTCPVMTTFEAVYIWTRQFGNRRCHLPQEFGEWPRSESDRCGLPQSSLPNPMIGSGERKVTPFKKFQINPELCNSRRLHSPIRLLTRRLFTKFVLCLSPHSTAIPRLRAEILESDFSPFPLQPRAFPRHTASTGHPSRFGSLKLNVGVGCYFFAFRGSMRSLCVPTSVMEMRLFCFPLAGLYQLFLASHGLHSSADDGDWPILFIRMLSPFALDIHT
jgi:hypothetical protein